MPVLDPVKPDVVTPVRPFIDPEPWRERFTDPDRICDDQKRRSTSPDVAP